MCLSNFTLTISEYCPLEKLPAAFGLHMVSKGVFVVAIGPLIGKLYVRYIKRALILGYKSIIFVIKK